MSTGGGNVIDRAKVVLGLDTTDFDQAITALAPRSASRIAATMKAIQDQIAKTKMQIQVAVNAGDTNKIAELTRLLDTLSNQSRNTQLAATNEATAFKQLAQATQEVARARQALANAPDPAAKATARTVLDAARQTQQSARSNFQDVAATSSGTVGDAAGFARKTSQSFAAEAKKQADDAKKASAEATKQAAIDKKKQADDQKEIDRKTAEDQKKAAKDVAEAQKQAERDRDNTRRQIDDAAQQRRNNSGRKKRAAQGPSLEEELESRRVDELLKFAAETQAAGPRAVKKADLSKVQGSGHEPGGGGDGSGGGGKSDLGYGVLMASQAIEDAEYGFSSIVNNIPSIASELGATAGIAGGISMAAVGINVLINNWEKLGEAMGHSPIKTAAQEMEELAKKTNLTASEFDRLSRAQRMESKGKEFQEYNKEEDQKAEASVTRAVGEAGSANIISGMRGTAEGRAIIDSQGEAAAVLARIARMEKEASLHEATAKSGMDTGGVSQRQAVQIRNDIDEIKFGKASDPSSELERARDKTAKDKTVQAAMMDQWGQKRLEEVIDMVRKDPKKFTGGNEQEGQILLESLEGSRMTPSGKMQSEVDDEAFQREEEVRQQDEAARKRRIARREVEEDKTKDAVMPGITSRAMPLIFQSAAAHDGKVPVGTNIGDGPQANLRHWVEKQLDEMGVKDPGHIAHDMSKKLHDLAERQIKDMMADSGLNRTGAIARLEDRAIRERLEHIIQADPEKMRTQGIAQSQDDDTALDILRKRASGQAVNPDEVRAKIESRLRGVGANAGAAEVAEKSARNQVESMEDRIKAKMQDEGISEVEAANRLLNEAIVDKFNRAREATIKAQQNADTAANIRVMENPPAPAAARPMTRQQRAQEKLAHHRRVNRNKAMAAHNARVAKFGGRKRGAAAEGGGGLRSIPPADPNAPRDAANAAPGSADLPAIARSTMMPGDEDEKSDRKKLVENSTELLKVTQESIEQIKSVASNTADSAKHLAKLADTGVVARVGR